MSRQVSTEEITSSRNRPCLLAFQWVKPLTQMVHLCATRFNIQHSTIKQHTALMCFVGFLKLSYTAWICFDYCKEVCLQRGTS